jgi:RNA polymerase sigma-70 factor (ECF subfamily)
MADASNRAPAAEVSTRARLIALYDSHGAELRRFVLGVVRDPDAAGDVMQATLSRALEFGHTARDETFKGWLFRVAYHEALAHKRREQAGGRARRRLAAIRESATSSAPADERLIRGEAAEAVRDALRRLPDDQRKVVLARVYDDKTFAEIARESGVPLGTVLTRMRRALAKLRAALGATHFGSEPDR